MDNLMIDIETMSNKPGGAIVSIGAVQFDILTGETGNRFYTNINLKSCQEVGLTIDADTVWWWLGQPKEAQDRLKEMPVDIEIALASFSEWVENMKPKQVWANAPSFDLTMLEVAFSKFGMQTPWPYWSERCVRTLVAFNPDIKRNMVNDLPHDAISDCLYQIKYCTQIYKSINIKN